MSDADNSAAAPPTSQAAAPAPAPTPAPAADASAPAPAPAPAPTPATADTLLGGDTAKDGEPAPAAKEGEGETPKPAEAEKPAGAPEAYEDFTMPDGIQLNGEVADSFKAWAKEHNLPQDKAQQVAELGAKLVQDTQAKFQATVQQQVDGWKTSSTNHPEFGGDKLTESLAVAGKALDTFGSAELKTMLRETGLGNHPEVIGLLVKVGKEISEDRFVGGKQAASTGDPAKSLYNNSQMN